MEEKVPVILIADDDPEIRELLRVQLMEIGMQVLAAADGTEVMDLLTEHQPDLLILDVNMPRLNGFELTKLIRSNSMLMYVPILLLTALDTVDNKVTGLSAGADDYVVKPFDWPELIARVQMHLRRARRDQELSPLTLLPGSPSIERSIEQKLIAHQPFATCYIDLDYFKSFNDHYGFIAGNDLLRMLAGIIIQAVHTYGDRNWLVGHIGGDDFVVVGTIDRAEIVAREIICRFDVAVPGYYAPEDRARGFICSENRYGVKEKFGIVTVSIAVVMYDGTPGVCADDISRVSAELKHLLKTQSGSAYMINRRAWRLPNNG